MTNTYRDTSYGLSQALLGVPPSPIISRRNPTVNDRAQLGQTWVNTAANVCYTLSSIVGNQYIWGIGPTVAVGNFVAGGSVTATTTVTATTGLTVTAGGATITAGGLTVTAGGAAITGNSTVTGSFGATTTVTAGTGLRATTGGVIATLGDITATAGNIVATAGNISTLGAVSLISSVGGFEVGGVGGPLIVTGAAVPGALVAPVGSLYINTAGVGHNDRLYISVGAGVWEVFTSA
jgi:hypothetical protein